VKLLKISTLVLLLLAAGLVLGYAGPPGADPYPTNDSGAASLSWPEKLTVDEEIKVTVEVFTDTYIHEKHVEGETQPTVTFLVFHENSSGWGEVIQRLPKDKFTGPGGHVEKTYLPVEKEGDKWVGTVTILPKRSVKSLALWQNPNKGGMHVGYNVDIQTQKPGGDTSFTGIKRVDANPNEGFHFPYFFYVPDVQQVGSGNDEKIPVLVQPNNTGQPTEDYSEHVTSARNLIRRRTLWADELGAATIVPVFPRLGSLYIHSLDHRTLRSSKEEFERVDLQLLAMVEDLKEKLSQKGIKTEEKFLMNGFSADGMFTNRFTIIHPEHVAAAAIGSPGGWPTLPLDTLQGLPLVYPLGVFDLEKYTDEEFNSTEFCQTPIFLYIGEEDENQHVDDYYYSTAKTVLGKQAPEIWKNSEQAYKQAGCEATFKVYPGVGHDVNSEMRSDVLSFLNKYVD